MRILITGAQGMLGHDVLRAGERVGHELIAVDLPELADSAARYAEPMLAPRKGAHRPFLTVRSKIPSVARRADSGTIGKRSLSSPVTFDQS